MTLSEVNVLDRGAFVAALDGVFERSPWVAAAVWPRRPFASIEALHAAMVAAMSEASADAQLALIRAHPELAGKEALGGALTAESQSEQSAAGLTQCSPEELARLRALNQAYKQQFGFPFVIAVKGADRSTIIARFAARLQRDRDLEYREALEQIAAIARLRLDALLGGREPPTAVATRGEVPAA